MTCHLLIQSHTYPLASIQSQYYDLQQSYAFEACLMLKEPPDFQSGISAQIDFGRSLCFPVEINRITMTPCLGGVQLLLDLVSPLQAQQNSSERYFVQSAPFKILGTLLKEEKLSWQIQAQETQTPLQPFFRQAAQTLSSTVVDLLQQIQWGQLFSLKDEEIVWQVGSLAALVNTQATADLPIASGEWGSQFDTHAYALSTDSQGHLLFESDALYWPVGARLVWQGKQFAVVAVELLLTDNRVTLGESTPKGKRGVKTQAIVLEKLSDFFLKKPLNQQGWGIATIEGKAEGSAVDAEGRYRVSMKNDDLLKNKHHRSPDLLRLHPFMNKSEGLHWPLHEGTTVITAFCDAESVPVIVGPILSETIEPKVTYQNAQTHALTTPGGSHWIVDEENNQLQFGTPLSKQRFAFEQDNIVIEAKDSGITQQIATAYTLATEAELLWQAGTLLQCQIATEWHSENESHLITAQTCHFMVEKEMQWFAEESGTWDIQGLCGFQMREVHWQAEQRLEYHCGGHIQLKTSTWTAQTETNLSVSNGQSALKLSLGRIQFTGRRCLLQAPIIQISAGCQTVIKVK